MAYQLEIEEYIKGDTINIDFKWDFNILDLTDTRLTFTLRQDPEQTTPDAQKSIEITQEQQSAGYALLSMPSTATELLEQGPYYYDIELRSPSENINEPDFVETIFYGKLKIKEDITKEFN